jgi:hypothetical protein
MKITALLKSNSLVKTVNSLLDPVRHRFVKDTPEERVRQALLRQMIGPLGFPKGLISVEETLLHHRRADILVYRPIGDEMVPLLLVECKAEKIEPQSYLQLTGYNASLRASFWCLAFLGGIETFWREGEQVRSVRFLPPYQQLLMRCV